MRPLDRLEPRLSVDDSDIQPTLSWLFFIFAESNEVYTIGKRAYSRHIHGLSIHLGRPTSPEAQRAAAAAASSFCYACAIFVLRRHYGAAGQLISHSTRRTA